MAVCRGQEGSKSSKGTLMHDFKAITVLDLHFFEKANVTTRKKKEEPFKETQV
jgi:hypothetical protein